MSVQYDFALGGIRGGVEVAGLRLEPPSNFLLVARPICRPIFFFARPIFPLTNLLLFVETADYAQNSKDAENHLNDCKRG